MKGSRHVHVFHRSDGKCIHDKNWDTDTPTSTAQTIDTPETTSIPQATLWPLIQVFIQFAREVQGGSVKRLVFRDPEEYAPNVRSFRSAPHLQHTDDKPPIVIHVAHDDLFVVAVTERLTTTSRTVDFANEDEENAPVLTIAEFCESCLDFLKKEQTAFLATLGNGDFENGGAGPGAAQRQGSENLGSVHSSGLNSGVTGGSSTSSGSDHTESHSETTESSQEDRVEPVPPNSAHDPVVSIDQSRLDEFISKTKTLLRG